MKVLCRWSWNIEEKACHYHSFWMEDINTMDRREKSKRVQQQDDNITDENAGWSNNSHHTIIER